MGRDVDGDVDFTRLERGRADRVLGIGRKMIVLIFGAPPHQLGLASSSICSSFTHRTNLYGPLPTGFRSAKTLSFPRK